MKKVISTKIMLDREASNEPIEVEAEATVLYGIDNHYGADADGNRYSSQIFIKGIFNITVTDEFGEEVILSQEERDIIEEELARSFFEN